MTLAFARFYILVANSVDPNSGVEPEHLDYEARALPLC